MVHTMRNLRSTGTPPESAPAETVAAADAGTAHPAATVLDSLNVAVLSFDAGLRLEFLNAAAEDLLGISARRATGRHVDELLMPAAGIGTLLRECIDSGAPLTAREVPIPVMATPGAEPRTVDITITPVRDAESQHGPSAVVEMLQVDRLIRLAREERLLERHQSNQQLLRGLAHEIKNPLGGLRGAAQLLARELPSRELREFTRIIIHEADRLRDLVERMTGPPRLPHREPVNIHQVLEHVRRLVRAENPSGAVIERDYDPSLPEVPGERDPLIQAVLNIVRNATQAAGDHGRIRLRTRIERQFTIGPHRHRQVMRIDIADNGPGIPEDLREHIFTPMVTGHPEGTGLGLAIAQDIIGRHGGLIECTSRPGDTCFTLYLPLESDHEDT
jgi:two-component system, NtrC family, nitrogen regulation sensor histidine kinase GlnL